MAIRMLCVLSVAGLVLGASIVALPAQAQLPSYLTTRKIEHVDDYHGTKVADPYRWLEDATSPETAAWVEAQNAVTFPYLERIPYRQRLLDRVMQLNNYERYSAPSRKGEYFFFQQKRGPAEPKRAVHPRRARRRSRGADRPEHVVRGRYRAVSAFVPSKAAPHAVYGISRSGSDWQQYKVLELATKRTLPDTVDWAKVSNVAWHGDGFYYSRYPEPPEGHEKASINEYHQVFFHRLGTEQAQDALVYEDPRTRSVSTCSTPPRTSASRSSSLRTRRGQGRQRAVRSRSLEARHGFAPLVPEITNDTFGVSTMSATSSSFRQSRRAELARGADRSREAG